MNKEEALKKIKELEEFVKELDKPKLVRVYVKEGNTGVSRQCGSRMACSWNTFMDKTLSGKLFEVSYITRDGSIVVENLTWEHYNLNPEWVVFVEGSYEDLKCRT